MITAFFRHNADRGFTLIELLVTITITVITLGMAIAGYLKFEQVQRVQQTARDVQQLFAQTRRKAQIKDQTGCQPTVSPNGNLFGEITDYQIKIISGTPMMRISQTTRCADPNIDPTDYPEINYDVPSSITITAHNQSITPDLTLTFLPLTAAATVTSPCPAATSCEIKVSDGSTSYAFDILPGGQIGSVRKI